MPLVSFPPLLHITQTTVGATAVDARLIAVAVLAFLVIQAVIWRPLLLRPRVRRRALSWAVAALVCFAVLPSVLPYDHLFIEGAQASRDADAVHETHCHLTPASCSDAPVSSGAGQLMNAEPLVVVPSMLAVLLLLAAPAWRAVSTRPEPRPPAA